MKMARLVILSLCKKAKNPQRLKENLPFLDTSLTLSMTASASLRAVFAKTAWQSINLELFLLFGLPHSLCSLAMTDKENALCYFTMTADFVILSVAKNPKNLRYALFMDTSLALSMINLGKSLNLIVCHAFTLLKLAMTAHFVILSVAKNPYKFHI